METSTSAPLYITQPHKEAASSGGSPVACRKRNYNTNESVDGIDGHSVAQTDPARDANKEKATCAENYWRANAGGEM